MHVYIHVYTHVYLPTYIYAHTYIYAYTQKYMIMHVSILDLDRQIIMSPLYLELIYFIKIHAII